MQKIYVIRGQYPKYAKNSKNSTSKQTNKQIKKNPNPKQPNQTMGGGCEETFPKEDKHMANRNRERCSSLVTREMQIRITMRHHLTPVRMTIIQKTTNKS